MTYYVRLLMAVFLSRPGVFGYTHARVLHTVQSINASCTVSWSSSHTPTSAGARRCGVQTAGRLWRKHKTYVYVIYMHGSVAIMTVASVTVFCKNAKIFAVVFVRVRAYTSHEGERVGCRCPRAHE